MLTDEEFNTCCKLVGVKYNEEIELEIKKK